MIKDILEGVGFVALFVVGVSLVAMSMGVSLAAAMIASATVIGAGLYGLARQLNKRSRP